MSDGDSDWIFPNPALKLIRQHGIYGLGGHEGCPCTEFSIQGVNVSVSCHKSESLIRVWSKHISYLKDSYEPDAARLNPIAEEVRSQVDKWYTGSNGEYGAEYAVSLLAPEDDDNCYPR